MMGLLLGVSAAQEPTVEVDETGTNATAIRNLEVGGVFYDVVFQHDRWPTIWPKGTPFDFTTDSTAQAALEAATAALNNEPEVVTVGPDREDRFRIPYNIAVNDIALTWDSAYDHLDQGGYWDPRGENGWFSIEKVTYAKFTEVTEPPDEFTIGGNVTGLVGSGLVLQNNGTDDKPIDGDGEFTFDTPLAAGSAYDVTVKTQPSNPAQTCVVENGSGTVPTEAVTDVSVSCPEPVLGDVIKVAAEGDTLTDGILLKQILLDGGVAINRNGQVAFAGRDDDNTSAVFTSDGRVAAEGDTLSDGTTVNDISNFGEVAINAGQSGDRVAFHGRIGRDKAVFTQAGLVAKEDDILTSGTLNEIKEQGKVAITNFDVVAFHGKIEIEVEDGLGDTEEFSAVFTSDGQTTQVAVREGDTLTDDNTVESIDETGGVAINDFFNEVAFHGDVVDPGAGGDTKKAVFTSEGLIAKEGDTLADGTTIVDDIDETGGVAINIFGDVAFHGDVVDPGAGTDTVRAVFTQDGLVAKEGDILPDGTILEEISEPGGVAINFSGDVAFHGRTGGVKAVFTQNGLIAKEGDLLSDGTTLGEIHNTGGVAINPYGRQVAFHGKVDSTDAVFVGLAP
jgi:hypothetical protein